jgi:hypothetical protein
VRYDPAAGVKVELRVDEARPVACMLRLTWLDDEGRPIPRAPEAWEASCPKRTQKPPRECCNQGYRQISWKDVGASTTTFAPVAPPAEPCDGALPPPRLEWTGANAIRAQDFVLKRQAPMGQARPLEERYCRRHAKSETCK